ncbi:hypothetical protein KDK_65390 [Dictyobacter kobayashii]|uniref:Uncharacterized protein n=1 Tax=Dictyobacter kobayashii TaxID=2014872 RepID=A0A402AUL5_9CHLR|nr:hypothetical protein KDK_65390 [Dictyobacter kobayashii]
MQGWQPLTERKVPSQPSSPSFGESGVQGWQPLTERKVPSQPSLSILPGKAGCRGGSP